MTIQNLDFGTAAASDGDTLATGMAKIQANFTSLYTGDGTVKHAETDIASAATCDLSTATTERARITGTTTITSFGAGVNLRRFVRFAGALTLTYNATSLILPGGANITTAAGDTAVFFSDGSGNWRCWSYERSSVLEFLTDETTTVASASTTDIGAAGTRAVSVTGTTTITSFGTTASAIRLVTFTGALTLTYNATSLILPESENITTVAGDTAIFVSDASGNWRCWSYFRRTPSGSIVHVGNATAGTHAVNRTTGDSRYLQTANLLDEDTMSSNSATAPASQQSIKAYVDNAIAALDTGTVPRGYIDGFIMSNGTDATNDIDTTAGRALGDDGTGDLIMTTTVVKQLDVSFAEYTLPGTASGGRDSSDNLTGAKWFNCYIIGGSGKNTQPFFSTSASPTLPSGFTWSRRVGSVYWNGSTLVAFKQRGDRFYWTTPVSNGSTIGSTYSNVTLTVPTGVRVYPVVSSIFARSGATPFGILTNPDTGPAAPASSSAFTHYTGGLAGGAVMSTMMGELLYTNTSAQIRACADAASTTLTLYTYGWRDARGKDA